MRFYKCDCKETDYNLKEREKMWHIKLLNSELNLSLANFFCVLKVLLYKLKSIYPPPTLPLSGPKLFAKTNKKIWWIDVKKIKEYPNYERNKKTNN